jgi:hypothetical protein
MYEIYSKKIKENRVKAFISELRKRKFYICDCDHLMSYDERIQFGERIESIRRLYLLEDWHNYAGDRKGSIGDRLRIHDEATNFCQSNDLMRSTDHRRKINLTKGEY